MSDTSREDAAVLESDPPAADPKPKKRRNLVVAVIAVVVLLVAAVFLFLQQKAAAELASAQDAHAASVSALTASIGTAEELLTEEAGVLDETLGGDLESEVADATAVLAEDLDLEDTDALEAQTARLDGVRLELDNSVEALQTLIASRETVTAALAAATEAVPAAEQVLANSEGKLNDDALRVTLAMGIEDVRTYVSADPNSLDQTELDALDADVAAAMAQLETAVNDVNSAQAEWQAEEDRIATLTQTYTGTGSSVVTLTTPLEELYIAVVSSDGAGSTFTMTPVDESGLEVSGFPFPSEFFDGDYAGVTPFNFADWGEFDTIGFKVEASGAWSVELKPLNSKNSNYLPVPIWDGTAPFSGKGDTLFRVADGVMSGPTPASLTSSASDWGPWLMTWDTPPEGERPLQGFGSSQNNSVFIPAGTTLIFVSFEGDWTLAKQ